MTYERFEDLPVWKDAIRLAEGCEDFLLAANWLEKQREIFGKLPSDHPARMAFEHLHGQQI